MNKIQEAFYFSLIIFLGNCCAIDCDRIPNKFSSYDEAIKTIKTSHFKVEESINTSKSSWIRGASYYSCDGLMGYFVLNTDKQDYLYSNMPIEIWQGFKNAKSFGSYYDHHIKHKYIFELN